MVASPEDIAVTEDFIAYRPSTVQVKRAVTATTAAGGKKRGAYEDAGEPITLRMVEIGSGFGTTGTRLTASGDTALPTHHAVTMPDADITLHDQFDWNGMTWEVLWVSELPDWRKQCEVIGRAG